jgi:hypothetical protein
MKTRKFKISKKFTVTYENEKDFGEKIIPILLKSVEPVRKKEQSKIVENVE